MKKLLLIISLFLVTTINSQTSKTLEIEFDIYVNNTKLETQYYFEMNADSMDIHFKTTQSNKFTCLLTRYDNYCFEFRHKDYLPIIIQLNGRLEPNKKHYNINLTY